MDSSNSTGSYAKYPKSDGGDVVNKCAFLCDSTPTCTGFNTPHWDWEGCAIFTHVITRGNGQPYLVSQQRNVNCTFRFATSETGEMFKSPLERVPCSFYDIPKNEFSRKGFQMCLKSALFLVEGLFGKEEPETTGSSMFVSAVGSEQRSSSPEQLASPTHPVSSSQTL